MSRDSSVFVFCVVFAFFTIDTLAFVETPSLASSLSIPVISWSPIPSMFSSPQTLSSITPFNFQSTLAHYVDGSASVPEIVVLFIEPELRTDQIFQLSSAYSNAPDGGEMKNIRNFLQNSAQSNTAPYGMLANDRPFTYSAIYNLVEKMGDKLILVKQGAAEVPSVQSSTNLDLEDLESYLIAHPSLFTNGQTELVVVYFQKEAYMTVHDTLVGSIFTLVSTHTTSSVAIYTADRPTPLGTHLSFSLPVEDRVETLYLDSYFVVPCNNTTIEYTANFFGGPMLEVYLMVFTLLGILLIGLCGLFELQTPERFDIPKASAKAFM